MRGPDVLDMIDLACHGDGEAMWALLFMGMVVVCVAMTIYVVSVP